MKRLLITANSPGELALVRAVARRAASRVPVEVLILPCSFATGQEARVAAALEGVSRVYPVSSLPGLLWRGLPGSTRLLHLGGDLMYSAGLAWRWNWPSWSYMWTRPWWNRFFQGFFTRNQWGVRWLLKRQAPADKIHCVGDLIADAVWPAGPPVPPAEPGRIAFLPGSRAREVAGLTPFFLEVAERLAVTRPELEFRLLLSPHIESPEQLLTRPPNPLVGGLQGDLRGGRLRGPSVSLEVRAGGSAELAGSLLAISIPGTKTAEAGVLGVPVLTLIPLNVPQGLPGAGLLGLLGRLPGGAYLVGQLLRRSRDRLGPVAQPNMLAGERFMPELVDYLSPAQVAEAAAAMLGDPARLASQRARLQDLYAGSWGASERLTERVLAGF